MTAWVSQTYHVYPDEVEVFNLESQDRKRPILVYFPSINVSVSLTPELAARLQSQLEEKRA